MRAVGIDYGERRIGLALSDHTGLLASPWMTLANNADPRTAATRVAEAVREVAEQDGPITKLVVGLPKRLSGEPNDQTPRVQAFASILQTLLDVPVTLQDERLTSHEADARLAARERDWRKRKRQLDAMAAAIILQDYLDSAPRP